MVNLVVDDKIVIKRHQPQRAVLANLDVAKSLFEFVLRRSEEFCKSIQLARSNPIELSVIFTGAIRPTLTACPILDAACHFSCKH